MKAFLVTILVLFSGVAMAQPGAGRGMQRNMLDELNLSEAQRKQVEQIHNDAMKQGIDRRAELSKAMVDLRQLARADRPDQAAMAGKIKQIESLRTTMSTHRLDTWFAINKILNPEQQKVWKHALERRLAFGQRQGFRDRMPREGMRERMMRPGWHRESEPSED